MCAAYRAVSDGYVWKMTALIPRAGVSQVIIVALCCLQLEGGSWPFASPLWFASTSALISALGGFGLTDMDGMAMLRVWDPDPPRTRAQVPAPTATRIRAVRSAIQRGRRNQRRRGPGRSGGRWPPSDPPASPGGAPSSGRR